MAFVKTIEMLYDGISNLEKSRQDSIKESLVLPRRLMELQHLIMDGMIDMARQTLIVESINGEICISHDGIDFKISSVSGEIKASNVNAAKMIITSIQSRKVRQHELDIPPCLFD